MMSTYKFDAVDVPGPRRIKLPKEKEERLIRYMHQTRQANLHIIYHDDHLLVSLHDGATNNEQTPGYHDYLDIEVLPLPVQVPWL